MCLADGALQQSALRVLGSADCLCSCCTHGSCGQAPRPTEVAFSISVSLQVMDAEGKLGSKRCKRFSAVIVDNTFKARHALAAMPE